MYRKKAGPSPAKSLVRDDKLRTKQLTQVGEEGASGAGEGAATEDDGCNSACGLRVGDANEAARFGFVYGHFGNERNAHAGANHGEQTGEVAAFENHARIEAGTVAGGDGGGAETMTVAEKEEGIAAEIGKLKRGAGGEFVIFGERGEETFGEERPGLELVTTNGEGEDGEIDGASAKTLKKDGSDFLGDGEMDFRKFAGEGSEPRWKPVGRDGGNGADDDGAGFGFETLGDFVFGGGKFVKNGTGAREKGMAEFGKADRAAEAIEEAAAEFRFELENLLGKGGLRDMAALGGPGERASVGDGGEVAELMEFHGERDIRDRNQISGDL